MDTKQILTLGLAFVVSYLLYIILVPFWIPFFWAIVLTILFYPFYSWLKRRLRISDSIASILTCTIIVIFLAVPVTFIAMALVDEIVDIYKWAETYIRESKFDIQSSPYSILSYLDNMLGKYIEISTLDIKNIVLKSAKEASTYMIQNLRGMISNFTGFILNVILSIFAMYYLFKDGNKLVNNVKTLLPLSETDKNKIFQKNHEVIYATLYGGVLVAAVQGALGGISFWILGLSSPVFWGTIMAILSFIPMVGPAIVWIPAAIYLFIKANYLEAIILVVLGVFIIGLVDNILRPIVVSGKTKIHPLLLLFSILGALKVLGFIGIIAGPIILSLALVVIEIYKASYLKKRAKAEDVQGV